MPSPDCVPESSRSSAVGSFPQPRFMRSQEHDTAPERVKGIEPSSLAWKAIALPLSYTRSCRTSCLSLFFYQSSPAQLLNHLRSQWGVQDSNLRRQCHQIYSLTPLATRETPLSRSLDGVLCEPVVNPSYRPVFRVALVVSSGPTTSSPRTDNAHDHFFLPCSPASKEASHGAKVRVVFSSPRMLRVS